MKFIKTLFRLIFFCYIILNNNLSVACVPPPSPTLLSATPHCNGTVTVNGIALPNNMIHIFENSINPIGTGQADGFGIFNFTTTVQLAPGLHSISALQITPPNCQSVQSAPINVVIPTTPSAPSINSITSNCQGILNVTGTGSANNTVNIFNLPAGGGQDLIGTGMVDGSGNFNITTSVALSSGQHTIAATQATVNCTSSLSAGVLVLVPAIPSVPVIISATGNCEGIINVQGTGTAGSIITLTANGIILGTGTVDPSGNFNINSTTVALNPGTYSLTLQASNSFGCQSGQTSPVNVTIPATPAAPILISASITNAGLVRVIGTAQANALIRVFADDTNFIGSGNADASGNFNFLTAERLTSGRHKINVLQVVNGCISARSNSIFVSLLCPVIGDILTQAIRLKYGAN